LQKQQRQWKTDIWVYMSCQSTLESQETKSMAW
jgi:hypothetical protein